MKKYWILIPVMAAFSTSCFSPQKGSESISREPQLASEGSDSDNAALEASFQALMNPAGQTEQEKEQTRNQEISKLIKKQVNFFYTSQDMVRAFDEALDKAYNSKIKNPNREPDLSGLERMQRQLQITWEFNEQSLHEIQYHYARLLKETSASKSPFRNQALNALAAMDKTFNQYWNSGERWAVHSITQDLDLVAQQFEARKIPAQFPQFRKFGNLQSTEKLKLFQQNLKDMKQLRKQNFDSQLNTQWEKYNSNRMRELLENSKGRLPQSAEIYPDAGKAGNINGSQFPTGVWAITMDDGPHPIHTPGMIQAISNVDYKGHFFWLSQNMKLYPQIVKRAGDLGFKRSGHSYTHANLPKLGESGLKKEIDDASEVFADIVGEKPTFFRCPYGACGSNNSRIRQKIANQKMIHVFWNVDSLDWQDKNPYSIFERVKKQMEIQGRGILLFHDIHSQSVEAMKMVVAYMKSKPNWKVFTLDEIVGTETGSSYPSP